MNSKLFLAISWLLIAHSGGPVDTVGAVSVLAPYQVSQRGVANVVIEKSSASIKSTRVIRVRQIEINTIEVVA